MQDGELVRGVEVRAIFVDGMADGDAEFVVRALEALVESVDPDGWVEVLHRCEGGFVKVAEDRPSEPAASTNGNETGQGGGGSDMPSEGVEGGQDAGDDGGNPGGNDEDEAQEWRCPWCDKVCASAGGLGSHKRACPERPNTAAGGRSQEGPSSPEVDCEVCGKTFSSRQALGGHMNAHRDEDPDRTPNERVFGTRDENVKGAKELSR